MTLGLANKSQALLSEQCGSHEDASICSSNPTVGIVPA